MHLGPPHRPLLQRWTVIILHTNTKYNKPKLVQPPSSALRFNKASSKDAAQKQDCFDHW